MDDEVFYDEQGRELRSDENPQYWDYANGKHSYLGSHKGVEKKTSNMTNNTSISAVLELIALIIMAPLMIWLISVSIPFFILLWGFFTGQF